MSTPYLQVCIQRHPMDCAVATMAMLLNKSYEEVLVAFSHNVIAQGASIRQIQLAARKLGCRIAWRRGPLDLETDSGVLVVSGAKWKADHLVILKEGLIIDTDATIWEPDVFMAAYEARPLSLLTEEGQG